jgi:hypothetical protein
MLFIYFLLSIMRLFSSVLRTQDMFPLRFIVYDIVTLRVRTNESNAAAVSAAIPRRFSLMSNSCKQEPSGFTVFDSFFAESFWPLGFFDYRGKTGTYVRGQFFVPVSLIPS